MSANIEYVNYNDVADKAKVIRSHAEEMNKKLIQAYQSVIDMREAWFGRRYNDLAHAFNNNLTPAVNDILTLTVKQIPFALETVANNFSKADQGYEITSAQLTEPTKMPNIDDTDIQGARFKSEIVTTVKEKVNALLKNVLEELNELESVYDKVSWVSESADYFTEIFKSNKAKITSEIEKINNDFAKFMQEAISDFDSTEVHNMGKA